MTALKWLDLSFGTRPIIKLTSSYGGKGDEMDKKDNLNSERDSINMEGTVEANISEELVVQTKKLLADPGEQYISLEEFLKRIDELDPD
jgi:hypothetical protein